MKSKKTEITKIENGYIDKFYCFKFKNSNDYNITVKKLWELKSSIVKFNINDSKLNNFYKDENFVEYLNHLANQKAKDLGQEIANHINSLDPDSSNIKTIISIFNSDTQKEIFNNNYDNVKYDSSNLIRMEVLSDLETFVNSSIEDTIQMINQNLRYYSEKIRQFCSIFLLMPLRLDIGESTYFINIKASIYNTGNLIIQYSIPIKDLDFATLYTIQKKLLYKAFLPEYIYGDHNSYEYSSQLNLEEALDMYNSHIINSLGIKISCTNFFDHFTLIDYTNKPEAFDSMSKQLEYDLYWLANYPFGFFNERENSEYSDFKSKRYRISVFCNLFNSTNARTIIAFSNKKISDSSVNEFYKDYRNKHFLSLSYIAQAIEIIMIKQTYYKELSNFKISSETSLNKLISEYNKIIDLNNVLFHLKFGGYGSVNLLIKHLQSSLTDFLPEEEIKEIIENYKEIISLKESELSEKRNYIISIIPLLFTVLFGLESIETLTNSLDKFIKVNCFKLSDYSIHIWIFILFITILLIYKHQISVIINKLKK